MLGAAANNYVIIFLDTFEEEKSLVCQQEILPIKMGLQISWNIFMEQKENLYHLLSHWFVGKNIWI